MKGHLPLGTGEVRDNQASGRGLRVTCRGSLALVLQGNHHNLNIRAVAMTMPFERTRAVLATREFLQDLTDRSKTPRVPEGVRAQARSLLRHYPTSGDMTLAGRALPNWFSVTPKFGGEPAEQGD